MISFATADYAVLIAYFVLILFVGFLATRRKSDTADFFLAGRTITLPIFVMTLVSSWYGGILGVGEFSYLYGISTWLVQGVPYYIFAILFAVLLAERIRATDLITIPDRLEQVYDRRTAVLGAFLTFVLTSPAPYVLMIGILLQVFLGWPLIWCIIAGTVVAIIYLFSGGLRADLYTDVAEFILMFAGFGVAIPFAVTTFGGFDFVRDHVPPSHLTWHGGNTIQYIAVWFMIALWTLVDPSFHQRCYAARSGRVAKRGILLSLPFWLIFDAMTATTGLYARAIVPDLTQPLLAFPMFAERVLPPVAKGLFYAGMLATVMSTLNTMTMISATSIGRDLLYRLRPGGKGSDLRYTRYGLIVTAAGAVLLCVAIPSVVRLWYSIGTVIIPGLLVPVVSSYFDSTRISGRYAFGAMTGGWLTSTLWLTAGWALYGTGSRQILFGIEPMFPGMLLSIVIWVRGRGRRQSSNNFVRNNRVTFL